MDFARPDVARRKRRRRILTGVAVVIAFAGTTWGLSLLKPAAPSIESGSVLKDTVRQGEMLRQVRGSGTLVPEQIQFVQAETDGRVERIFILPGAEVKADTILLELSNPQLKQDVFDAEWQSKAAEAQLTKLKAQLEGERLTQKALVTTLKGELTQCRLEAEADENLNGQGLVPSLTAKRSRSKADELGVRVEVEEQRLKISAESTGAQLAVQNAEVEKARAWHALKSRQLEGLKVRAGIDGVLQQIGDTTMLQVGQRVTPSSTLAKIVQPSRLKAEVKVPATQAKDIIIGQKASIDTRNGFIPGRVVRVDPAVQNETVTVDVQLEGSLPKGARPDLSIEGLIEVERLENVLYVGRPVMGQPESTIGLFKVTDGGRKAVRTKVKLGRSSVLTIQILQGLQVGDQIVISDMSAWDNHDILRLN